MLKKSISLLVSIGFSLSTITQAVPFDDIDFSHIAQNHLRPAAVVVAKETTQGNIATKLADIDPNSPYVFPPGKLEESLNKSFSSGDEDIFQSLYLDREGKDMRRIKDVKAQIEKIDLKAYGQLAASIREDKFDAIDAQLLEKAFPFFKSLAEIDDHGTTALGHTLEVYDAFVRIVNLDEDGYHSHRQETFKADNNLDGLMQEIQSLRRKVKGSEGEKDKQKLEQLEKKRAKLEKSLAGIGKQKLNLKTNKKLKDILGRIKSFKDDGKTKELFFLLPLLHDVGKLVKASGHAEIGARYFVGPILKKLGFNDELIEYAKTVIEKHVDIATVITTERTPEYLKEGLDERKAQEMMDILTILSLADRSYGDRAHRMDSREFDSYLEWGYLRSNKWEKQNNRWHLVRLARYLGLSSLDDARKKVKELISAGYITEQDASLFKKYIGSRIKVFDYAYAVFNYIVDKDKTGKALVKLLIILSKMSEKYGDDIYRINLFKKPESWLEVIYKAADKVDVKLSPDELGRKLAEERVIFTENMGRFLNVTISNNTHNKASSAGLSTSDSNSPRVDIDTGNGDKIGPIKAVIFDWDNTIMWERKGLFKHQVDIILEIWHGENNYGEDSNQWKAAETFYNSTLGIGCEQRF